MKIKAYSPVVGERGEIKIKIESETGAYSFLDIDFAELASFASCVSPNVVDFFIIASCVYGTDRFIMRKNHSIDGWSREITISLPVYAIEKWQIAKHQLESALSFLTGDHWTVKFHKNTYKIPSKDINDKYLHDFSLVSLFSGGLDSLIGVIDYLENNPKNNIILISHYDPEMPGPKGDQKDVRTQLLNKYKGRIEYIPSVKISLSYSNSTKETTFRSRSIIFIGLALLVSKRKGIPIMVPENGTVSLNYPLSPSRRSACSTRTTHPTYFKKLVSLWHKLGIDTTIFNPYSFNTKGEMVGSCANRDFLMQIVADSNSCGKRGHRTNWNEMSASHCGICLPCTYRRAALLNTRDRTQYGNEINKRHSGRNRSPFLLSQQGQDIVALLEYIKNPLTQQDVKNELIIGGLDNLNDINEYVDVVLRAKEELKQYVTTNGNTSIKALAGL